MSRTRNIGAGMNVLTRLGGGNPIARTRAGGAGRQSIAEQMAEMVALSRLQRALSPEESERLGLLIYREQQRARYRPARIARLRAELELLEGLEMATRGASAEGCARADPVDLVERPDGCWAPAMREAA